MIELENHTSLPINLTPLEAISNALSPNSTIELIITNEEQMRQINHDHRGKATATDVLSFPLEQTTPMLPLGSIVICDHYLHKGATQFGHTLEEELALLFIHGLLHLLGFDHEVDEGQMRAKERALIEQFSLPQSLIIRT
jgi:probable rRNA maturation factor